MIGNRQRSMPNLGGIYTKSGSLAGEIILATHDPADSDGEKVIQITFLPCSVQIRSDHGNTSLNASFRTLKSVTLHLCGVP